MDRETCKSILVKLEWKNMLPFYNLYDGTYKLVEYSIFNNLSDKDINDYLSYISSEINEKSVNTENPSDGANFVGILIDRIKGCLCGLGIGDAVGGPLEFSSVVSTKSIPNGNGNIFQKETKPFSSSTKTKSSLFSFFNLKNKRRGANRNESKTRSEIDYTTRIDSNKNRFGIEATELNYKYQPVNKFFLKPGQFTDDTSMALCLADSLIYSSSKILQDQLSMNFVNESLKTVIKKMKEITAKFEEEENVIADSNCENDDDTRDFYDAKDLRCRFACWWNQGYNNSFRFDDTRPTRESFGMGRTTGASLRQINQAKSLTQIPLTCDKDCEGAGNGSIMRLAPVAIRFCNNLELALKVAKQQSDATHPGRMASEACRFLTFILVKAITRPSFNSSANSHQTEENIQAFLDSCVEQYLKGYEDQIDSRFVRLIKASEKSDSLEENWNWRAKSLHLSEVCKRRIDDPSHKYNPYEVVREYFGVYAPDGLAIALFSAYNTTNFDDAIQLCVNHLGDADTNTAICGQICGAFYGFENINPILRQNLSLWDRNEIALRSVLLYSLQQFD